MSKKRCTGKNKNGKRCYQKPQEGFQYCLKHQKIHDRQKEENRKRFNQIQQGTPTEFIGQRTVKPYDYKNYLQSHQWKMKAAQAKKDNPNCSLCNGKRGLHVHHRTYVRCGKENRYDLVVLCSNCHKLFHDHYEYSEAGFFLPKV